MVAWVVRAVHARFARGAHTPASVSGLATTGSCRSTSRPRSARRAPGTSPRNRPSRAGLNPLDDEHRKCLRETVRVEPADHTPVRLAVAADDRAARLDD